MRAVRVHPTPEGRRVVLEEVPKPEPRPGQVLVRVAAIGVNRADLGGAASGEPAIPGLDVAGVVEEVGPDVSGWKAGEPVAALVRGGAYAEFTTARAGLAYRPPEGMSMVNAASLPCVFLTAWYALTKFGRVQRGETVLIHAAGSGVGTAGIQIARALGARVLTSAGSEAKLEKGRRLGAEAGVNYSTQDVGAEIRRLTQGRGVDMALDPVGGSIFDATVGALAPGGRVVTVGGPAGARAELDPAALEAKGQSVQAMGVFNDALADAESSGWAQLKAWFQDGTLRPVVDRVLPWSQAETALGLLTDRAIFGKIVLTVEK